MKPRGFQALARHLLSVGSPAAYRSAISRAYYSAFHVGKEILHGMQCPVSKHGIVAEMFQASQHRDVERAGSKRNELYGQRVKADYELRRTDVERVGQAQAALDTADTIIADLTTHCHGPQSPAIKAAIQRYYADS